MGNVISYCKEFRDPDNPEVVYAQGVKAQFDDGTCKEGEAFTEEQFSYVKYLGEDWEKGHLLAKRFGGKNSPENMLPMTKDANLRFKEEVEDKLALLLERGWLLIAKHFMDTCDKHKISAIVYDVQVSKNKIPIGGIRIPKSFSVNIYVSYSNVAEVDYPPINEYLKTQEIPLELPFSFKIDTNFRSELR